MSIDYILDYGCQPKKLLGLGGVLDGSKIRLQAEALKLLQESGEAPSAEPITLVRITPDGQLDQEQLTPGELEKRAAGYLVHAGHCRGCPANVVERVHRVERVFGCHGVLDYPLSENLEFLLYVTLRFIATRELDAPPSRLVHFILETGISGEASRSARESKPEQGPAFAVRPSALSYTFNGPEGEATVDTDQLLEALFFGSRVEPQVLRYLYQPFFETMEKMIQVVIKENAPGALQRLADRGVVQMREFGAAVAMASELGCNIVIDL